MENAINRFEHDEAVRLYALHLLSQGYEVRARVEGWFQAPDYIFGYRPDIVANKGDEWLVVEIKKSESDWPKISALERIEHERAHFKVVIASPQDVMMERWVGANDR
jgi:REase_AHJR-like